MQDGAADMLNNMLFGGGEEEDGEVRVTNYAQVDGSKAALFAQTYSYLEQRYP